MLFNRGKHQVLCHFCNIKLLLVPRKGKERHEGPDDRLAFGTAEDFVCGVCGSQNKRDLNGELVSSLPAMKDPELNKDSFARRGSPAKTLTTYPSRSSTPFCSSCLNNQSLQIHLLAAFPDSDDSDPEADGSSKPHLLPEYKKSLDSRYPLVCAACAGGVDEVLQQADYKAKAYALGARLRESQRIQREKEKRKGKKADRPWQWWAMGVAWRARGVLFLTTHVGCIGLCGLAAARPSHRTPTTPDDPGRLLPLFCGISLLWMFWDPTWQKVRQARARGRQATVEGRGTFLIFQMIGFVTRLALAVVMRWRLIEDEQRLRKIMLYCLLLLVPIFISSFTTIRIREATNVRLRRPPSLPSPLPLKDPITGALEPLASLSITPARVSPQSTPPNSTPRNSTPATQRRPSLQKSIHASGLSNQPEPFPAMDLDDDGYTVDWDNSMDWEPLTPKTGAEFTFGPQRFFQPVKASGLEDLFEKRLRFKPGEETLGSRVGERRSWWSRWKG
ncbi:hypothetical protein T439DRAFT_329895 [Meredithblackwellia eburnea MCA 4105]